MTSHATRHSLYPLFNARKRAAAFSLRNSKTSSPPSAFTCITSCSSFTWSNLKGSVAMMRTTNHPITTPINKANPQLSVKYALAKSMPEIPTTNPARYAAVSSRSVIVRFLLQAAHTGTFGISEPVLVLCVICASIVSEPQFTQTSRH